MFCLTGLDSSNSRGWARVREEFRLGRLSLCTEFRNTVWRSIYNIPPVSHNDQVAKMMDYVPHFLAEYQVNEDNGYQSKLRACLLIVERICRYLSIRNDKLDVKLRNNLESMVGSMKRLLQSPTPKPRRSIGPPKRETQRENQTPNVLGATEDENVKAIMKEIQKTVDLIEKLLEVGDDTTVKSKKKMEVAKVLQEEVVVTTVPPVGTAHGIAEILVNDQ
jgi:hypothetical protein